MTAEPGVSRRGCLNGMREGNGGCDNGEYEPCVVEDEASNSSIGWLP